MHLESRRVTEFGRDHGGQISSDLALLCVGARCCHTVAIRGRGRSADEMVVLVGGDDEERILSSDAVLGEPGKELPECLIVGLKLLDITGFAGPEGLFG